MKIADYIVLGVVLAYAVFMVVWMIRRKKRGQRLCCGNCEGCDRCVSCEKSDQTEENGI